MADYEDICFMDILDGTIEYDGVEATEMWEDLYQAATADETAPEQNTTELSSSELASFFEGGTAEPSTSTSVAGGCTPEPSTSTFAGDNALPPFAEKLNDLWPHDLPTPGPELMRKLADILKLGRGGLTAGGIHTDLEGGIPIYDALQYFKNTHQEGGGPQRAPLETHEPLVYIVVPPPGNKLGPNSGADYGLSPVGPLSRFIS